MKDPQKAATSAPVFTEEERDAMKERAKEQRTEARRDKAANKADVERAEVLAKIADMSGPDRAMSERLHAVITASAPDLSPRLWYGQPAYARAGKVVCFFRSGQVDKARYSTLGFSVEANLDEDGGLWPTSYALTGLNDAGEAAIAELVKKAVR